MPTVTWPQALAWRLGRHGLDPPGRTGVVDLVRRLAGVQAQVASAADQAAAVRAAVPKPGSVSRALAARKLVKTWAMRGTLHALAPDEAGAFLALLADGRSWEKPSWQRVFLATPAEVEALVAAVREALDGRVLSREELTAEVVERTGSAHLRDGLTSGWSMLLKPAAWQGQLCHGPSSGDGRVTFTRPDGYLPGWVPPPAVDEAAPVAIRAYLRAYGPATPDSFGNWLLRGVPKTRLRTWYAGLSGELATVDVDGAPMQVLACDLDALLATKPSKVVRLLPGFDQWVLGPGTAATEIVPAERRALVSRTAGWISPVVLAGGRAAGVWEATDSTVEVRLWDRVPRKQIEADVARIAPALGVPSPTVRISEA